MEILLPVTTHVLYKTPSLAECLAKNKSTCDDASRAGILQGARAGGKKHCVGRIFGPRRSRVQGRDCITMPAGASARQTPKAVWVIS